MVTVNKYLYEDDFGKKYAYVQKNKSIKYYSEKLMKQN